MALFASFCGLRCLGAKSVCSVLIGLFLKVIQNILTQHRRSLFLLSNWVNIRHHPLKTCIVDKFFRRLTVQVMLTLTVTVMG